MDSTSILGFDELINKGPQIRFVAGPIAAGKSVYVKMFKEQHPNAHVISVGDAARFVSGKSMRSSLQKDPVDAANIAERIDDLINVQEGCDLFVIDGPRQIEVIEYFIAAYGLGNVQVVWLDPGYEIRKSRFYSRNLETDSDSDFDDANQLDDALGLKEIKDFVHNFLTIH